jgi:hypothetical protein
MDNKYLKDLFKKVKKRGSDRNFDIYILSLGLRAACLFQDIELEDFDLKHYSNIPNTTLIYYKSQIIGDGIAEGFILVNNERYKEIEKYIKEISTKKISSGRHNSLMGKILGYPCNFKNFRSIETFSVSYQVTEFWVSEDGDISEYYKKEPLYDFTNCKCNDKKKMLKSLKLQLDLIDKVVKPLGYRAELVISHYRAHKNQPYKKEIYMTE